MAHDKTRSATVTESLTEDGAVDLLSPQEERALRMRQGRTLTHDAPLSLKAEIGTETGDMLRRMEAEIFLKLQQRTANPDPAPSESRVKSKIVRSLRKKG